jgi:hypothetical protein
MTFAELRSKSDRAVKDRETIPSPGPRRANRDLCCRRRHLWVDAYFEETQLRNACQQDGAHRLRDPARQDNLSGNSGVRSAGWVRG